jgi:hypothetical protein
VQHPRRQTSSYSPPWEPQILLVLMWLEQTQRNVKLSVRNSTCCQIYTSDGRYIILNMGSTNELSSWNDAT